MSIAHGGPWDSGALADGGQAGVAPAGPPRVVDVLANPAGGLIERAGRLGGRISRLHAELVDLAEELLEIGADGQVGWDGMRSPEHWLAVHTGLPSAQCKAVVALARRRGELPATIERLQDGAISVEQAGAIARHAPSWAEGEASRIAQGVTTSQFARVMSRYTFPEPDAEPTDDAEPEPERAPIVPLEEEVAPPSLEMSTWGGRFHLRFEADELTGALVESAIREAKDALFTAGRPRATLAEGLVEVASRSLAAISSPSRRDHYRIMVHLATDGSGWLGKRGVLPPALVRHVTCEGRVRPVWLTEGAPVNVGRSQRIVPERTRRLVEDRDGGCRYPGCRVTGFLECHHITHWADGGRTDMDGLVSLCPGHHDAHHRGEFTITGTPAHPDGLVFHTANGTPIARHYRADRDGPSSAAWFAPDWDPDRSFPRGERLDHQWLTFGEPPGRRRARGAVPRSVAGIEVGKVNARETAALAGPAEPP